MSTALVKTGKQERDVKICARWNVTESLWDVGFWIANTTFKVMYRTAHYPFDTISKEPVDLVSQSL